MPDRALLDAASQKKLHTPKQVAQQAKRMLADPRARSKLRYFFHHWLLLDEKEELAKDPNRFADFNQHVASDLRTSLENVQWGGVEARKCPSCYQHSIMDKHYDDCKLALALAATAPDVEKEGS